jgi:2-oxoglutarate ferredoxin oxidoreductase subunit gamma
MHQVKKTLSDYEERYEISLSGSGGQGLIFAGTILAEAVGIHDGKNVTQTQSYGPEARGGASRSDIVVSPGVIYYPKTLKLDLLLALTQEACDTYYLKLREDGILVIDSGLVDQPPARDYKAFPFTQVAKEKLGTAIFANIIALGTLAALTRVVSKPALIEAVKNRAPRGTLEANLKALELGFDLTKKKKGKTAPKRTR